MGGGEKTEKPTPRRIQKAREDGQVAKSQDLTAAVMLGTACVIFLGFGPFMASSLRGLLTTLLSTPYRGPLTQSAWLHLLAETGQQMLWLLAPMALALVVAAIGINLIQVRPLLTFKPLVPKLEKINPLSGVKRLFSLRSVMEAVKALIKMGIIGAIGTSIIWSHQEELASLSFSTPDEGMEIIVGILLQLSFWAVAAYLVMGYADWQYQSYEHTKKLKMSKQDIKDEHKNMEGDPQTKGRMRQMGQSMIKKQQLAKVPTADVVITNPTHFAIAIVYDPDVAPAPHVVAKGVDHFALKIKEVAKENGVLTVENRPLARSLYDQVDYGEMIPPDLFVAVAEILALVYRKKGGRQLQRPPQK